MDKIKFIILLIYALVSLSLFGCDSNADKNNDSEKAATHNEEAGEEHGEDCSHDDHDDEEDHSDHEDCSHDDHDDEEEDHSDHEDCSHDDHDDEEEDHSDHDDHGDHEGGCGGDDDHGLTIEVSSSGIEMAGIEMSTVEKVKIKQIIELSGEVGFNTDKLLRVIPRFGGIIKEVNANIGRYVKKGDILAVVESNESLSPYNVKAPISGRVISKNAIPGAKVGGEEELFTIADLSTVWANFHVYSRDLNSVKRGQEITVKDIESHNTYKGVISYVAPLLDTESRSALLRVVVKNRNGEWRPGMFLKAVVETEGKNIVNTVDVDAVQYLDGESVVFTPDGNNKFAVTQVTTGLRSNSRVEIVKGIEEGDRYVSKGAFELKAKIVTSSLDPHAGHGH